MSENRNLLVHRRKILVIFAGTVLVLTGLFIRLVYFMIWQADHYSEMATQLHERERSIKAARGRILDRNGFVLADNCTVCTISVIHNQIQDPERVTSLLSQELGLDPEWVRKRVDKYSSIERIKSNVDKSVGDRIREYELPGVKVDEDYKRYYPYGELASKVLGFTGGDNQGIIGLEVVYDKILRGTPGKILTMADARGIEIEAAGERRLDPQPGQDLRTTLDLNIQKYATQLAQQAMQSKEAASVSILVMNPQNGEVLAMVNVPEFDLNHPYELEDAEIPDPGREDQEQLKKVSRQDLLNKKWRNNCINDTYEPGSTFKIITASAGLEEGVITPQSTFFCPGYVMVEDRKIRCHKTRGHGSQDFTHCMMNSCNPALISTGLMLGKDKYYAYFRQFDLLDKTGIDLPGEARTIMHDPDNMGAVELATVAFGQSFQVTPIRLLTTVSELINGGNRITPHLGLCRQSADGNKAEVFPYETTPGMLSSETSDTLRQILEMVVAEGTGKNGKVAGFRIGGKTATSQTLPRGSGKYIASYIGFAPAQDPQVIAIAIVNDPKGNYYGGQVAAPIIRQLFENILPYLGILGYNER